MRPSPKAKINKEIGFIKEIKENELAIVNFDLDINIINASNNKIVFTYSRLNSYT